MKTFPLFQILKSSLINLPSPSNINSFWNLGFLLGIILLSQLMTGIFLSFHYTPSILDAFHSMNLIYRDINFGWIIQLLHMNGASAFFILIYMHISRGIFFNSPKLILTWLSGMFILLLLMVTAFLGYVLPWGQMSFWGATVITNLISAIPALGEMMVQWIWGGFSVSNPTLNRFYSLHFLLPFMLIFILILHLFFLHQTGSNNPLGTNSDLDKIPFTPYFLLKDLISLIFVMGIFSFLIILSPLLLSDPENFNPANPLITPIHIQPEWYFLFAYAILRSIPNKLGGVVALVASILILSTLSMNLSAFKSTSFSPMNKTLFWSLINTFLLLTWIGSNPIETPFLQIGQLISIIYFSILLLLSV